jgi:hypothetical protein
MLKKNLALVFALVVASLAQAQTAGVVTLRANQTSSQSSFAPVLTWSTTPVAQSCVASGGWSGTRAASGTQTQPTINGSTNYTLTCSWGGGTATVSWIPPTTNSNGTPLLDLAGYKVVYGTSAGALTQSALVSDVTRKSYTVQSLTPGTWYFAVRAVNTKQVESADSNVAQKNVSGASASSTVPVTISQPTLRTASTVVYDVVRYNGRSSLGRQVGTIALGKPCASSFRVGSDYYQVTRSDVSITRSPRSQTLVARCATG